MGTFRRKIEEVKTGLFVTFGSQEPASKTSGKNAVDTISQRGEIPLGDVLTPRTHGAIQGELCEDKEEQGPRVSPDTDPWHNPRRQVASG